MKKIFVLLLAVVMLFALGACGDNDTAPPADNQTPTPTPAVATPEIATPPPQTPPPPQEETPSTAVGSTIQFGDYDWLVLDVQDGRALILTEDIIAIRQYHPFANPWEGTTITDLRTTWAESYMRQYLNDAFINGFSAEDRVRIAETTVVTHDNPWHGTPGGADTTDRIFLLSIEEVVQYFGDSGQLQDEPEDMWMMWTIDDQYNDVRIARMGAEADVPDWYYLQQPDVGTPWMWWLRSPGSAPSTAITVLWDGTLGVHGAPVCGSFGSCLTPMGGGVRPAMWIYLNP